MMPYWPSILGGMAIGLATALLLVVNGRVAGVSGIFGQLVHGEHIATNAGFILGLATGVPLYLACVGHWPAVTIRASLPVIAVAGFLVGIGTRMGSGCTSGHGVVGLARLSPRSFVAVATFLAAGVATVTLMRMAGMRLAGMRLAGMWMAGH